MTFHPPRIAICLLLAVITGCRNGGRIVEQDGSAEKEIRIADLRMRQERLVAARRVYMVEKGRWDAKEPMTTASIDYHCAVSLRVAEAEIASTDDDEVKIRAVLSHIERVQMIADRFNHTTDINFYAVVPEYYLKDAEIRKSELIKAASGRSRPPHVRDAADDDADALLSAAEDQSLDLPTRRIKFFTFLARHVRPGMTLGQLRDRHWDLSWIPSDEIGWLPATTGPIPIKGQKGQLISIRPRLGDYSTAYVRVTGPYSHGDISAYLRGRADDATLSGLVIEEVAPGLIDPQERAKVWLESQTDTVPGK